MVSVIVGPVVAAADEDTVQQWSSSDDETPAVASESRYMLYSGSGDDYTLTTVIGISTSIALVSTDVVMIRTLDVVSVLLAPGSRPV